MARVIQENEYDNQKDNDNGNENENRERGRMMIRRLNVAELMSFFA